MKMWIGNLDGDRAGLVITSSKERARRIVRTSRRDFDDHWVQQLRVDESLEFEVLYTRGLTLVDGKPVPWQQGICKLTDREVR